MLDVLLQARDRGLYHAITDCGAGGFSSAVGEMGEKLGAPCRAGQGAAQVRGLVVHRNLDLRGPGAHGPGRAAGELANVCDRCAQRRTSKPTVIGTFEPTGRLRLFYQRPAGRRPRHALPARRPAAGGAQGDVACPAADGGLRTGRAAPPAGLQRRSCSQILSSCNVCSKEWIIRQYDHEVQGGSVVKPLVGVAQRRPRRRGGDHAGARLAGRGLAIGCGINPHYGDLDPYCDGGRGHRRGGAQRRRRRRRSERGSPCSTTSAGATPIGPRCSARWCAPPRPAATWPWPTACRSSAARTASTTNSTPARPAHRHSADAAHQRPGPGPRRAPLRDDGPEGAGQSSSSWSAQPRDELGGSHYHLVTGQSGGDGAAASIWSVAPRSFAKLHEAIAARPDPQLPRPERRRPGGRAGGDGVRRRRRRRRDEAAGRSWRRSAAFLRVADATSCWRWRRPTSRWSKNCSPACRSDASARPSRNRDCASRDPAAIGLFGRPSISSSRRGKSRWPGNHGQPCRLCRWAARPVGCRIVWHFVPQILPKQTPMNNLHIRQSRGRHPRGAPDVEGASHADSRFRRQHDPERAHSCRGRFACRGADAGTTPARATPIAQCGGGVA